MPPVREPDEARPGALQRRLSPEERDQALSLSRGLLRSGVPRWRARRQRAQARRGGAGEGLGAAGELDYLELVDAETLKPVEAADRECVLLTAVRFPSARLIDNVILSATDR